MNYCDLIKKIAANPHEIMSVHLGHIMTVRDMYSIKEHVDSCENCQITLDELNEKYPAPNEFYKGELN